jgi:hypothetical protein
MSPSPRERCLGPATVLLAMLVLLVGCSSASDSPPSERSSSTPSPSPRDLTQALGRYAIVPCALLTDEERADFGITHPGYSVDPPSEGPGESCYWLVSSGIQVSWVPYPPDAVRNSKANERGSRRVEIAGYAGFQTADEKSCYQNVTIGSHEDFIVDGSSGSYSIVISRTESDAPKGLCEIATSFSKLIISRLRTLDLSD